MGQYNLKIIRELINDAFTLGELQNMCYEVRDFRPVYDLETDKKSEFIRELMHYSERKGKMPLLLATVQEYVPDKYAEYEGRLTAGGKRTGPKSPPRFSSKGQLDYLTKEFTLKKRILADLKRQRDEHLGSIVPPQLNIEIEDLEAELAEIEEELEMLLNE
jgi:hypothetical protein